MDPWLVVIDMPYYPSVHPCASEADARKVYDHIRQQEVNPEQVVYLVKVEAQDREQTPGYDYRGAHCLDCFWAVNPNAVFDPSVF